MNNGVVDIRQGRMDAARCLVDRVVGDYISSG